MAPANIRFLRCAVAFAPAPVGMTRCRWRRWRGGCCPAKEAEPATFGKPPKLKPACLDLRVARLKSCRSHPCPGLPSYGIVSAVLLPPLRRSKSPPKSRGVVKDGRRGFARLEWGTLFRFSARFRRPRVARWTLRLRSGQAHECVRPYVSRA
jgi:hypothetical protein